MLVCSVFFKIGFRYVIPSAFINFKLNEEDVVSVMTKLFSSRKFLQEWFSDKCLKI